MMYQHYLSRLSQDDYDSSGEVAEEKKSEDGSAPKSEDK
jgi:hypothetical protein